MKSIRIRSYTVQMRRNADQNNSEYGHFLRSAGQECFDLASNYSLVKYL